MFQTLTDGAVERIAQAVCTILEKQGIYCESESLTEAYKTFGAHIDANAHTVRFARSDVIAFIDSIRKEDKSKWDTWMQGKDRNLELMYSGYVPYDKTNVLNQPPDPYFFHCTGTYFYDDQTDTLRRGNADDFIECIKFGSGFHPKAGVGQMLLLPDQAGEGEEPLIAAQLLLEYAHNPSGVYVQSVEQIKYIHEIMDIAGIDNPYFPWMANASCNAPLKIDRVLGERYAYMIRSSLYPAKVYAMPVNGINVPITVAGATAVMAAEMIALWIAARCLTTEKIPLVGMPISGTMDMSTGNVSFTSPDTAATRIAVCDFFNRYMSIRLTPGPGEFTPSKTPSLYNTLDKAYFAMISAAYSGYHPGIGIGHIDAGLAISLVQLLYDYDYTQTLRFFREQQATHDEIGLDTIKKLGFAKQTGYLMEDHTLQHIKSTAWIPQFFDRNGWSQTTEEKAKAKALERIAVIKSQYKKPNDRDEILHKCHKVIERAKKNQGA